MMIRAIRGDYAPSAVTVNVPILTPTVMQWTGASPWMDLVQRALVWEAREPDLYVNVFFGFPWADVPDAGMTIQATANANPALARKAADDMAAYAWRRRAELASAAQVQSMAEGVRHAAEAMAALADPGQAEVPILTIALDSGFQSIGPFNRAFKAQTGVTPTAYRKQAESRSDRPISGIGEAAAENGKT